MGEFADMALSETMDMEDLRFEYRIGKMSIFEAYELGIVDEHGAEPYRPMFKPARRPTTCKYCLTQAVRWHNTAELGWRLYNKTGELHTCQAFFDAKAKE